MVGHQVLDLGIGVRIPAPEPICKVWFPARGKIIRHQRRDFRGKKFGFHSGDAAAVGRVGSSLGRSPKATAYVGGEYLGSNPSPAAGSRSKYWWGFLFQ